MKQTIPLLPLNKILLEMDAPFLPIQGILKNGNSTMIPEIAGLLAERLNWPLRVILAVTHENAIQVFQPYLL